MADPPAWAKWTRFWRVSAKSRGYQHLDGYALESQARRFTDSDLTTNASTAMSGTVRRLEMRVAMARVLLGRPDILLMDEQTNHLDIESIVWSVFPQSFSDLIDDFARSRIREPSGDQDRRDRWWRNHAVLDNYDFAAGTGDRETIARPHMRGRQCWPRNSDSSIALPPCRQGRAVQSRVKALDRKKKSNCRRNAESSALISASRNVRAIWCSPLKT